MTKLLDVKDLSVKFFTREGIVNAVNNINFSIKKSATVGIVGESGSGKSVCVMSIIQLINSPPGKIVNGKINFNGVDLLKLNINQIRNIRGNLISMIFLVILNSKGFFIFFLLIVNSIEVPTGPLISLTASIKDFPWT